MPPRLSVEDLSFSYRDRRVLHGITFSVDAGEVLGSWGRTGAERRRLSGASTGCSPPPAGEQ